MTQPAARPARPRTLNHVLGMIVLLGCGDGAVPHEVNPPESSTDSVRATPTDAPPVTAVAGSSSVDVIDAGEPSVAGAPAVRDAASAGSGDAGERSAEPPPKLDAGSVAVTPTDAGPTEIVDTVEVAAVAAPLAAAICGALRDCVGPTDLSALTRREDCTARFAASLEQSDFGSLEQSQQLGHVVIDLTKLDACLRDTRALGCALQTERLPASCQLAIAGQRNIGESCNLGADCGADAFCPVNTACPRACQATKPQAAACSGDDECLRGLVCEAGVCSAPAKAGAACGGTNGAVCALGLGCVGGSESVAGTCQPNATLRVGKRGESCGGDVRTLCVEGLSCGYDGKAVTCQGPADVAASCHLTAPGQCPNDSYCNATDAKTAGRCTPLPRDGQACVLGDQCAPGHACVAQGLMAICQRQSNLGEACSSDAGCRSGACSAQRCSVRPRCP